MFTQVALFIASLFTFAVNAVPQGVQSLTCTTGNLQCCYSIQTVENNGTLMERLRGVGAIVNSGVPVGIQCSPLTTIGISSGSSCEGQAACCEDTSFNGTVALGCNAINTGL